jgi:2',3'-cyclic-nucleotide 2'-phosphodiesterase (5'-nucleotidase family)
VQKKDAYAVYIYDNTLYVAVRDYNNDLWAGTEYKLDVTKPVDQRVVELKLNGQPLVVDQVVRIALNNYRATGKIPTAPKQLGANSEALAWIREARYP